MTLLYWLINIAAVISLGALSMTLWNLRLYRPSPSRHTAGNSCSPKISVCVPARNEESNLRECVQRILANDYRNIEVLVYDDHSTDSTPEILRDLCREDDRVRQVPTRPLPEGWNGKQFGCEQMGQAASGQWLLFTDADVRFEPHALSHSLRAALALKADLVSTFPRQLTGSLGERLMLPMINFILFSYLPMIRMRQTNDVAASAGCGQFLFVNRDAWLKSGGHAAFKNSMHDGIKLPRSLRNHGFHTDLFDGTEIASVRMYNGMSATWRGFAKNAYEGLGSPILLTFLTVLHLLGHVMPWVVLAVAAFLGGPMFLIALSGAVVCMNILQRLILAYRFKEPLPFAVLHPVSVLLMVLVQWHSAMLHWTGRRSWRGRTLKERSACAATNLT